jgi:hypothetical protein
MHGLALKENVDVAQVKRRGSTRGSDAEYVERICELYAATSEKAEGSASGIRTKRVGGSPDIAS